MSNKKSKLIKMWKDKIKVHLVRKVLKPSFVTLQSLSWEWLETE
ncbi:MAG: hypothetical protein ACTS80_01400 [Candidatus Hodgkinia cicadicola]